MGGLGGNSQAYPTAISRPRFDGGSITTTPCGMWSQNWPTCTRRRSASSRLGGPVLRRILTYSEKVLGLVTGLGGLVDSRISLRIPSRNVLLPLFVMLLARLDSLIALEQLQGHRGV